MFKKVLIANRGNIALRVLRACKELGIETVAIYSKPDKALKHVLLADQSICIGPASSAQSYLNIPAIIAAAEVSGADAIHPGFGFLSEKADFSDQVTKSGFTFIGPTAKVIETLGDKITAIKTMGGLGVPCVPGSGSPIGFDINADLAIAEKIGYPVLVKASSGGGGRGMRVVNAPEELQEAINITKAEAKASYDDDTIYMEKYLQNPRHVEIQVIIDKHGNGVYLGSRDCSMQRRHQKVLEEAPALGVTDEQLAEIGKICVNSCISIGYTGVGTFEFLYENGKFYFIEVNTRIQVEHPITEMITGVDLVKEQISVAFGNPLSFTQDDIKLKGYAIECRINAEDPETFVPSPGTVERIHVPGGLGIRWESFLYNNYKVLPFYDSLIAQLVAFAPTREEARLKMKQALDELVVHGIKTNVPLHEKILNSEGFINGQYNIHYLENKLKTNSL